jgi:hypothetical protein
MRKATVLVLGVSAATVAYTVARKPELATTAFDNVKDRVTNPNSVVRTSTARVKAKLASRNGSNPSYQTDATQAPVVDVLS